MQENEDSLSQTLTAGFYFLIKKIIPGKMKEIVRPGLEFGFRLFAEVSRKESERNILISPLSVSLALSIVYNGARGKTRQAIAKTLQVDEMKPDELNQGNASLLASLTDPDPRVRIIVANALWADKEVRFKQTFLTNTMLYGAEIANLDFHSSDAVDAINNWVSRKTHGRIPAIADESVLGAVLMILNAVYFKGTWKRAFEKSDTREETFILPGGVEKKHPMMFQRGLYRYHRGRGFQAVSLPYGYGRVSMYVFLPDGELDGFYKTLGLKNWNRWMPRFRKMEGTVGMPRFKMEYSADLEEVLMAMGMGVAFDEKRADFGDMAKDIRIWIDKIRHKTYLRVDERGSEAAAATEVVLEKEEPPEETFTMIVNRPFFLAIRDNETGAMLFMGSITDPEDVEA